jgi:hypothetical protein
VVVVSFMVTGSLLVGLVGVLLDRTATPISSKGSRSAPGMNRTCARGLGNRCRASGTRMSTTLACVFAFSPVVPLRPFGERNKVVHREAS